MAHISHRVNRTARRSHTTRTGPPEKLNAWVCQPLGQMQEITAEWLQRDNEKQSRKALAKLPPSSYRTRLEAGNSP